MFEVEYEVFTDCFNEGSTVSYHTELTLYLFGSDF